MTAENLPVLISGGMGVAVSNWRLAKAVAEAGQKLGRRVLGVVSGTGIEEVSRRRLQDGDKDQRRAIEAFPLSRVSEDVLNRWYVTSGSTSLRHRALPRYRPSPRLEDFFSTNEVKRGRAENDCIAANFAEVWLAKKGHGGPIGINHLAKIQSSHPFRLFGAMLAGVDYVLEGAGIPLQVPGILDGLSRGEKVSYRVDIAGTGKGLEIDFDPAEYLQRAGKTGEKFPPLERPPFLAIVSSNFLAEVLVKRSSGTVDGFVIEGPTAGGHNASPRGEFEVNKRGEPIYGPRDEVDLIKMGKLGLPFWLAGSYGSPQKLREALDMGASGVQIGTIFALCEESGLTRTLKEKILSNIRAGKQDILTSGVSPTGFPFKVAMVDGTLADHRVYEERVRRCTIGELTDPYGKPDGSIRWLCPAGPEGGNPLYREGAVCLCSALIAAAGFPQEDRFGLEPSIVTLGNDQSGAKLLDEFRGGKPYTARDVVEYMSGMLYLQR